jgi:predicted transposase/invertase (TIGR01784 family)
MLGFRVRIIKVLSPVNAAASRSAKASTYDFLVVLEDGSYIIVELQVKKQDFIIKRMSFYSSQTMYRQFAVENIKDLKTKLGYDDIKKVYAVSLLNFEPFEKSAFSIHHFETFDRKEIHYDPGFPQEYYVVEMTKLLKDLKKGTPATQDEDRLFDWVKFIASDDQEVMEVLAQKDPMFKKAYNEVIRMSLDKRQILEIMEEELYELDINARIADARSEERAKVEAVVAKMEAEKAQIEARATQAEIEKAQIEARATQAEIENSILRTRMEENDKIIIDILKKLNLGLDLSKLQSI